MKDAVMSVPVKSKNVYSICKSKSIVRYCPEVLNAEDEYYKKKNEYLQRHLYKDAFEYSNTLRLSLETIRNKVINLQQLIFEVTDSCNLRCKYCGYGEFYEDHDERINKKLTIEQVRPLLDYLLTLWKETGSQESFDKETYISFPR